MNLPRIAGPAKQRLTATGALILLAFVAPGAAGAQSGERLLERAFDVGASPTVQVDLEDADIQVESHAGSGVEVWVSGRGDREDVRAVFEAMDFEATATGQTVRIRARDADMGRDFWRSGRHASLTVWVSAPAGSTLDLRTADGDIRIDDLQGDADLRSSDGDIVVGDVDGRLSIRTSDGDVTAGRLSGPVVDLQSSDGDLQVEAISGSDAVLRTSDGDVQVTVSGGSLEARSGDGSLSVDVASATELRLQTGDGDVVVRVPAGYGADVLLEGEDLNVDQDVLLRGRISDDRIQGTMNEGGPPLEARTGDGTVSLRTGARQVR